MVTNSEFWSAVETGDTSGLSSEMVHPFEYAGLGKAPFQFIGCDEKKGTCQYCGRAIATKYYVRSADDRTFWVGCDCVMKTNDDTLVSEVKEAKRRIAHRRKIEKRDAELEVAKAELAAKQSKLESLPHPKISGKTFAEYIQWRLENLWDHSDTLRLIRSAV